MGLPSWFLEDPADVTGNTLPRKFTWMSERYTRQRARIRHETQRGIIHAYELFTRRVWRYQFRVPESMLDELMEIDTATFGDVLPFYFVPDVSVFVASPLTGAVLVRKEQEFQPVLVGPFYWEGIGLSQIYDYTLELTEELEPVNIED